MAALTVVLFHERRCCQSFCSKLARSAQCVRNSPVSRLDLPSKRPLLCPPFPIHKLSGEPSADLAHAQDEAPLVVDYKDFSGDGVHFQVQLVPGRVPDLLAAGAHNKLKLVTRMSTGAHA